MSFSGEVLANVLIKALVSNPVYHEKLRLLVRIGYTQARLGNRNGAKVSGHAVAEYLKQFPALREIDTHLTHEEQVRFAERILEYFAP